MDRIELLTKAEAAEILHVSDATVERLIAGGQLPVYRIARAVTRIDKGDVYEYLESRRVKAANLRQTRIVGPKDLRRQKRLDDMPSGYYPGMKGVDPRG